MKTYNVFIDIKKQRGNTYYLWKMQDPFGTYEAENEDRADIELFRMIEGFVVPCGWDLVIRKEEV